MKTQKLGTTTKLKWFKGPANGGEGTAGRGEDGADLWMDGDKLLVIVETTTGRDIFVINVLADDDQLEMQDSLTGEILSEWSFDQISWYAKLDEESMPSVVFNDCHLPSPG